MQYYYYVVILDTEDASETDMAKLEEEFTEMKEQWVMSFVGSKHEMKGRNVPSILTFISESNEAPCQKW